MHHGIITTDADGRPQRPPGGEFIDRYVFPGGELANLPRLLTEIARCGLEATAVEDLRPHFARTLTLWGDRLEANRAGVTAAGGAERYRIWWVYLAGMAHAFERRRLSVVQIVACKPTAAGPAPASMDARASISAEHGLACVERLTAMRECRRQEIGSAAPAEPE